MCLGTIRSYFYAPKALGALTLTVPLQAIVTSSSTAELVLHEATPHFMCGVILGRPRPNRIAFRAVQGTREQRIQAFHNIRT